MINPFGQQRWADGRSPDGDAAAPDDHGPEHSDDDAAAPDDHGPEHSGDDADAPDGRGLCDPCVDEAAPDDHGPEYSDDDADALDDHGPEYSDGDADALDDHEAPQHFRTRPSRLARYLSALVARHSEIGRAPPTER